MKAMAKRVIRDEDGKILILVLVLLVVGGLLLGPLLGLMSTGLAAGQTYEKKAAQVYAADAGVEDAIWKIQHADEAGLPDIACGDQPWDDPFDYQIPGAINDNNVQVSIEYLSGLKYRITSTAADGEGHTTVTSYVKTTLEPIGEWDWDVVVPEGESYPGGKIEEGAKVYAEGDLTVDGIIEDDSFVYVEGNLTVEKIEDGCTVYVEGNLLVTESMAEDDVKVCVGGDAWIPKIETGSEKESVKVYVGGNLTVYMKEGVQRSGNIEDEDTVVCVGGELVVEGEIDDNPAIHTDNPIVNAPEFEPLPFDGCPICCWDCLVQEFAVVVEVLSYNL